MIIFCLSPQQVQEPPFNAQWDACAPQLSRTFGSSSLEAQSSRFHNPLSSMSEQSSGEASLLGSSSPPLSLSFEVLLSSLRRRC